MPPERSACAVCASRQYWEPDYSVAEGVLHSVEVTVKGRTIRVELHPSCKEALLNWAKAHMKSAIDQELRSLEQSIASRHRTL